MGTTIGGGSGGTASLSSPTVTGTLTAPVRVATPHQITYANPLAVDFANGDYQYATLTGSPSVTFTGGTAGQVLRLELVFGSGSGQPTWGTAHKGADPVLTTTLNTRSVVLVHVDYDGAYAVSTAYTGV